MTYLEKVSKSEFAGKYHQPKGHIPAEHKNRLVEISISQSSTFDNIKDDTLIRIAREFLNKNFVFCKMISACTSSFYTAFIGKETEQ